MAYRPRNTPVFSLSAASRSMSLACLVFSRYEKNSIRTLGSASDASSLAKSESAATTINVAPYSVSGRVVKTVIGSFLP